ncbi:MAG: hypothetical protein F6K18_32510 [Okeania sp. SIO2C2]|uniref:hypothetical protein n=1 Tax=Okeania sp. SIO2C2 TaxID=2607787 RepID=UPI0013BE139F|nr:hypothetical protein [Okeania sp. SIO2C2]NEP91149.1 hypothetical protein [Okeania sp. SIO2C2]
MAPKGTAITNLDTTPPPDLVIEVALHFFSEISTALCDSMRYTHSGQDARTTMFSPFTRNML